MNNCIFCKIVSREVSAPIVMQNEYAIAFPDRSPKAPIHMLVVPKTHISSLNEFGSEHKEVLWGMLELVQALGKKYGGTDCSFNIRINTGTSAGQEVFHVHWHFTVGRLIEAQ